MKNSMRTDNRFAANREVLQRSRPSRARVIAACLAVFGACGTSGVWSAVESAPPPGVAEDWSVGVWQAADKTHFISGFPNEEAYEDPNKTWTNPPPLTPAYLARYNQIRAEAIRGRNTFDQGTDCSPLGIPFNTGGDFQLMEILFKRGQIAMSFEAVGGVRRIFTDGRGHPPPDELVPTYNGHSVGHWDGRTLVIDTVGLRDDTYLEVGMPHSDKLHVIEKWRQVGPDELTNTVTLIDPEALTKPWGVVWHWKRHKDWSIKEEFCTVSRDVKVDGATTLIGPDGKPVTAPPQKKE
jgi:hypothetical protein